MLMGIKVDHGRFDAWFRVLESTIEGRGRMGSMVGASEEVRRDAGVDSSLNEYAVSSLLSHTSSTQS